MTTSHIHASLVGCVELQPASCRSVRRTLVQSSTAWPETIAMVARKGCRESTSGRTNAMQTQYIVTASLRHWQDSIIRTVFLLESGWACALAWYLRRSHCCWYTIAPVMQGYLTFIDRYLAYPRSLVRFRWSVIRIPSSDLDFWQVYRHLFHILMAKNILVTGATGKQGGAVIDALANNPDFTLLAVTRNGSGAGAQKLTAKGNNIKVVEGNLDDVPALFKSAQEVAGGSLWGVYSVQLSIGKGITHDGEIWQGKAMVDESIKAGVEHFVYSSVERGGDEASWNHETPVPHFQTKHKVEHYLRDKAGTMGWTILRPVAFMDNLEPGFQSKVFLASMRDTLGSKPCQWVATADIGIFAKLAFEDPAKFNHRALGLAGDELNTQQLSEAFDHTTGSPLNGSFSILGSMLKFMVGEMGKMIDWFATDGYKVNIPELRKMHPGLLNMEQWIVQKSNFPTKAT
nr:nmra-like family domain-containing protein 1 [Quercus suber]